MAGGPGRSCSTPRACCPKNNERGYSAGQDASGRDSDSPAGCCSCLIVVPAAAVPSFHATPSLAAISSKIGVGLAAADAVPVIMIPLSVLVITTFADNADIVSRIAEIDCGAWPDAADRRCAATSWHGDRVDAVHRLGVQRLVPHQPPGGRPPFSEEPALTIWAGTPATHRLVENDSLTPAAAALAPIATTNRARAALASSHRPGLAGSRRTGLAGTRRGWMRGFLCTATPPLRSSPPRACSIVQIEGAA